MSLQQEIDDQGRDDREGCARRNQVVVAEELALEVLDACCNREATPLWMNSNGQKNSL